MREGEEAVTKMPRLIIRDLPDTEWPRAATLAVRFLLEHPDSFGPREFVWYGLRDAHDNWHGMPGGVDLAVYRTETAVVVCPCEVWEPVR